LAAGFAHEIKNPLTSISALVQALPQNIEDKEFRDEFSEIVPRQIQKTMELITKMLSYGQERELAQEQVSLADLCARNIRLLNQHAVKYGVRIEQEIIYPIVIKTDAALWDEIFLNLMLNGIQAMPKGGVLKIVFSKNKEQFLIEIRDAGVGMPEEMLSKIFQPLFTTRKTGTGMGLAIVERNLARMDVEIRVHSQPGGGTTFTLMFPHRI
jgi:two-component system sporulation sensor kinase B